MKQRLLYIDNLKGFLILLVVLGHCIQSTCADFDHNIVARYICSFHMPLFMAVSGFVSYKPELAWLTVWRRFKQLIVPFLAWAVLGCCINLDPMYLIRVILHPDSGLWFLWALFFIILALKLCYKVGQQMNVKLEWVVIAVTLAMMGVMVVLNFKLFGFQFIAWYFPFYCIGYFGRKYYEQLRVAFQKAALPLLGVFLLLAYWWMRKEPPTFMPANSSVIYNYVYKFLVATVAIAAFVPLFQRYANRKILIMSYMGGVTLGIYAIHFSVIHAIVSLVGDKIGLIPYPLYVGGLLVVVTSISWLVYWILSKNRYTAFLFIGK